MNARLIALAFVAALAGCASSGTQPATGNATSTPAAGSGGSAAPAPRAVAGTCNAQPVQSVIGQAFTSDVASSTQQRANAGTVRILRPGQVMTMEYNPQRLTVIVDANNVVETLRCG